MAARKTAQAFRTITEVSTWLDTPSHVLRFWESKFKEISPVKRAGGRRYYRPEDLRLIGGIKVLLHDEGKTIAAVQDMLKSDGKETVEAHSPEPVFDSKRRRNREDSPEPSSADAQLAQTSDATETNPINSEEATAPTPAVDQTPGQQIEFDEAPAPTSDNSNEAENIFVVNAPSDPDPSEPTSTPMVLGDDPTEMVDPDDLTQAYQELLSIQKRIQEQIANG